MSHHHSIVKNLKLAFLLNFSFSLIEFVGGFLTNSTAILADAVHDLGDSFALAQAWYFQSLTRKKGSEIYTYGYRRFALLGAVLSMILLLMSSFYVISETIPRIIEPEHSNAQGMLLLAIVGVGVNLFAMLRLMKENSENIRVVALHLLEDVLGWVAVLIVSLILLFKDIYILDPILALLITLYILYQLFKRSKNILPIFLQATPKNLSINDLSEEIKRIEGVDSVHHLHVWSLDGEHHVLTCHVVIQKAVRTEEYFVIKQKFRKIIQRYQIDHSTLEIEQPDEACRIENKKCQSFD